MTVIQENIRPKRWRRGRDSFPAFAYQTDDHPFVHLPVVPRASVGVFATVLELQLHMLKYSAEEFSGKTGSRLSGVAEKADVL